MRISDWSSTCALPICWRFLSSEHLAAPSTRNTLRAYTDEGEQRLRLDQRVPFYRSVIGSGQKLPLPCGSPEVGSPALSAIATIRPTSSDHAGPCGSWCPHLRLSRSEEHTSELQSLMRISYDVFCLKKKHLQTK